MKLRDVRRRALTMIGGTTVVTVTLPRELIEKYRRAYPRDPEGAVRRAMEWAVREHRARRGLA